MPLPFPLNLKPAEAATLAEQLATAARFNATEAERAGRAGNVAVACRAAHRAAIDAAQAFEAMRATERAADRAPFAAAALCRAMSATLDAARAAAAAARAARDLAIGQGDDAAADHAGRLSAHAATLARFATV